MGGAPTPIRWIAEAEDLRPSGTSGTMSGKGGPRATLHCTVSRTTQFLDMHRVLTTKQAEPHLLYSFAEDRLGQYFPLDRSARALMGSGRTPSGISHNRVGTVNIQIEVVGTTDDWTTRPDWRPGPRFRAMMAAIASWGIEPEFIYRPALTAADRANVVRSFATMVGSAGGGVWWGHCHYPDGESHWDPGRVNVPRFFAAAYGSTPTPTPTEPPKEWYLMDIPQSNLDQIRDAVLDAPIEHPTLKDADGKPVTWPLRRAVWSDWYYSFFDFMKGAADADVDEAALAQELAPVLAPLITPILGDIVKTAIAEAGPSATPEQVAAAVVQRLGEALAKPAA